MESNMEEKADTDMVAVSAQELEDLRGMSHYFHAHHYICIY
jgi:hypothetical protein